MFVTLHEHGNVTQEPAHPSNKLDGVLCEKGNFFLY